MQGSHRAATPSANAINSFVLADRAPSAIAARPRPLKLFITSGAPVRRVAKRAEMPYVSSTKLVVGWVMLASAGLGAWSAGMLWTSA